MTKLLRKIRFDVSKIGIRVFMNFPFLGGMCIFFFHLFLLFDQTQYFCLFFQRMESCSVFVLNMFSLTVSPPTPAYFISSLVFLQNPFSFSFIFQQNSFHSVCFSQNVPIHPTNNRPAIIYRFNFIYKNTRERKLRNLDLSLSKYSLSHIQHNHLL